MGPCQLSHMEGSWKPSPVFPFMSLRPEHSDISCFLQRKLASIFYYSRKIEVKVLVAQSRLTLCDLTGLLCPWNSPGKNTGADSHPLVQGIFPTQGSNPGLPYYWQILYHLSHQGSPRKSCI